MDNKLEPCPFCGGTEAFVERLDYSSSYVQCDSAIGDGCACLARGPVGVQDDDGEEIPGASAAIAAWNRRAPAPQAALPAEGVPFPPLEFPVMTHDKLGPLWDRLGMQLYALKYSDLVRAATSPAPAVVQMTDEQIESDIRSEFELWGNKYGLNAKYVQGACWDAWQSCSSIWQARMNALGAAPAADLAAAILALPLPEPEYRQEQCIKPTAYTADQMRDLISAAAALAKQVPAQEQALTILREFVRDSVEHDVGGGDVVVTTCEVLEKACKLVDSLRDPSLGVCGVKPSECPDHTRCGCEKRMAAQLAQSADKAEE
jgi:hypothetical protein